MLKGLTEGEWYWRVAQGKFTTIKFNELMRFKIMFDPEEKHTGLASLFVGKKIADKFLGLPVESYVTLGYARHFEKDYQVSMYLVLKPTSQASSGHILSKLGWVLAREYPMLAVCQL